MSKYFYIINKNIDNEINNYNNFLRDLLQKINNDFIEYGEKNKGVIINNESVCTLPNLTVKFINECISTFSFENIIIGCIKDKKFNFSNTEFNNTDEFKEFYENNGGDNELFIRDEENKEYTFDEFTKMIKEYIIDN